MSKMAATTSPALPAFSYAQAAKGLAPATTSSAQSQAGSSSIIPGFSSTETKPSIPDSERPESQHTPAGAPRRDEKAGEVMLKMARDEADITSTAKSYSENDSSSTAKQTFSSHPDSKQISESTSPSLVASVAMLPREDEYSSTPNGSSESWDKQSEASAMAEKSVHVTESGKDKSADDDWVNVPAPKAEKELKAAPIPAVNIWQQRREAQEAKAKTNAALRSSAAVPATVKSNLQTQPGRLVESQMQDDGTKKRASGKLGDKGDVGSKKKQADDTKSRDDGSFSFLR
jgi:la-related protein 1